MADLTPGASVSTCRAWVAAGHFNTTHQAHIPRLLVRRQGAAPLASTFAGVFVPYVGARPVTGCRRLPLTDAAGARLDESHAAVEITLADGARDLLIATDPLAPPVGGVVVPAWDVRTDAEFCVLRRDAQGAVTTLALARGARVDAPDLCVVLPAPAPFLERAL